MAERPAKFIIMASGVFQRGRCFGSRSNATTHHRPIRVVRQMSIGTHMSGSRRFSLPPKMIAIKLSSFPSPFCPPPRASRPTPAP